MRKSRVCWMKVCNKRVLRVPVLVKQSWLDREYQEQSTWVDVLAYSVADAINLVRDEIAPHVTKPTELFAWGVKGGKTCRFIGWDSLICARLPGCSEHEPSMI